MSTFLRSIFKYAKVFFFEKVLVDPYPKIDAKIDVEVCMITNDELQKIAENFENLTEEEAERRLKMGHLCFGAILKGKIVHLRWVSLNETYIGDLERKLEVPPGSAWVYDAYTILKYRGSGISPKVFSEIAHYLKEVKHIEKVYLAISHDNFPSLRTAQKEGLRKIAVVAYMRIWRWRLYRLKSEIGGEANMVRRMLSI